MKSLKIKVCGMKYPENIDALVQLNPDFIGFIFYPPSKRFIGLDFEKQFLKNIPSEIIKTGVFVNATLPEVVEFGKLYGMKAIQLHGQETPQFCEELRIAGFKVIKAFGIDENFDFEDLLPYQNHVDLFLFDTKTVLYGGSGETFSWQILDNYKIDKPFLLSGGISLANLDQVLAIKNANLHGIDINSRFEIEPGLKDIELLKMAFKKIKK
ncbi:phosphoribosylanthranilate isomerase [Pedobacter alpinus]|uniref:N-(5'-phosphoribosyl)anthranilate isomerase n=1 Tax=Pedobacter alpinus TaxID=1590643 RepID=A0ABW5TXB7_9SPHI